MSTWHQQRATPVLYHETKWTVVSDPPNGCLTVTRHDTVEQAQQSPEIRNLRPHCYVLPPSSQFEKKPR